MKRNLSILAVTLIIGMSCNYLSVGNESFVENYIQGNLTFVTPNGMVAITNNFNPDTLQIIDTGYAPVWSFKKDSIAYINDTDDYYNILVYNLSEKRSERIFYIYKYEEAGFGILMNSEGPIHQLRWDNESGRLFFHAGGNPARQNIRCIDLTVLEQKFCETYSLWAYPGFDISSDGRILFLNFSNAEDAGFGLAIYDIETGKKERDIIPLLPTTNHSKPSWSPDNKKIAWCNDNKLLILQSNGRGEKIIQDNIMCDVVTWSPDGQFLAYDDQGYIWITDSNGEKEPIQILQGSQPNWK